MIWFENLSVVTIKYYLCVLGWLTWQQDRVVDVVKKSALCCNQVTSATWHKNINTRYKCVVVSIQFGYNYIAFISFVLAVAGRVQFMKYFYKYINPAGHSKGMPSESPGMIGRWLGYRIFSSYIKNKKFKIDEKHTSELILNSKTYKP